MEQGTITLNHAAFKQAEMTEKEADALDELWTKTTPQIKVGAGGGFFAEHRAYQKPLDKIE
jgi:hypothetical protein